MGLGLEMGPRRPRRARGRSANLVERPHPIHCYRNRRISAKIIRHVIISWVVLSSLGSREFGMPDHLRLAHVRPFQRQPIVYLTVATEGRREILSCAEANAILREIWENSRKIDGWVVGRYVLMPDHAHLFGRGAWDAKPLWKWMQTWKSISSRRLTAKLEIRSPIWQRDYFDRFLRSADSYSEKWNYVVNNPVRAGFVKRGEDWPWQGVLEDLTF